MNFDAFNQGVYNFLVTVGITVSTTLVPSSAPHLTELALKQPEIIESTNIASEPEHNFNLGIPDPVSADAPQASEVPLPQSEPTPSPSMQPVEQKISEAETKPVEVEVTVPKPITVKKPSPSPSAEPKKKEETKVLAAETEEKTEKSESSPVPLVKKLADNAEKLFQMVNDHRKEIGLPSFEKDDRICKIAEARAPQVHDEVFGEGPIHKGFKALNLSYWATENAASYESIERNFKFWMSDYIHKKAIEGPSKYSCVACSGTSCSQIFTSFAPKE